MCVLCWLLRVNWIDTWRSTAVSAGGLPLLLVMEAIHCCAYSNTSASDRRCCAALAPPLSKADSHAESRWSSVPKFCSSISVCCMCAWSTTVSSFDDTSFDDTSFDDTSFEETSLTSGSASASAFGVGVSVSSSSSRSKVTAAMQKKSVIRRCVYSALSRYQVQTQTWFQCAAYRFCGRQ